MPRQRTPLGTAAGSNTVVGQVQVAGRWVSAPAGTKPSRYRARVKFRDQDGVLRDVERFDRTKAKAETKLKAALVARQAPTKAGGALRPETLFSAAGKAWLAQVDRADSGLAASTRSQYRDGFGR